MTERPINIQSLATPAIFMVSADVFPMRRNTAMLRPAKKEPAIMGQMRAMVSDLADLRAKFHE